MARQREGDVSTFHFIDNLSRAIRHGGRILLDLIPKVYTTERMIRVLGEDLTPQTVQIAPTGQPVQQQHGEPDPDELEAAEKEGRTPNPSMAAIYDLTIGKYDLTVSAGPSFTTRREEAAMQMEAFIQKAPESALIIGDLYAKSLDWPGADEIAERLKRMVPPQALGEQAQQPQIPPEVQQMIEQGGQMIQQLQQQLAEAQQQAKDKSTDQALKAKELQLKEAEIANDAFRAETERMKAAIEAQRPSQPPAWPTGTA